MFSSVEDATPLSILLVEDDLLQQKLILFRLRQESFTVVTVSDASQALREIGTRKFAVAIVDLGLPDSSGLDLVRELNARAKETRIIICSADSSFTTAKESLNLGVVGYVEKSEDLRVLVERVHHAASMYLNDVLTQAEGEIRFHLRVLDVVEYGVIATNLNYELIYWNRYAIEILGNHQLFINGSNALDFLSVRKSCKAVLESLKRIQRGESLCGDTRLKRATSEYDTPESRKNRVPVRFHSSPILDKSNVIIGFVFSFSDISNERKICNSLKILSEHQSARIQISSLAISADSIHAFLVGAAQCLVKTLRIDRCEFIHEESCSSCNLESDRSLCVHVPIERSSASQRVNSMVLYSKTPRSFSEEEHEFLKSISKVVTNTIGRFVASNRWQSLYENSLNAIILTNDDGICLDANFTALNLLSYTNQEIQSKRVSDLIFEDCAVDFESLWMRLLMQKSLRGEVKLKTKTADEKDAKFVAVANVVPGVHMFDFRDVTEERRLEEKVYQDLGVVAHFQRNAAIGQMAAVLAHEINQPLGAISNFIGGLLLSMPTNASPNPSIDLDEHTATLREVQRQAIRAGEIVKRLRRFVSTTSGEGKEVDLNELILETMKILRNDFRIHQVESEVYLDVHLSNVLGDSIQIQQVLVNLLKNAVEAMLDQPPSTGVVRIHTNQQDGLAVIRISDNGPGANDYQLSRMFQPYYTSKPDGLGLGLSISKSIVNQHQGRIEVARSEDGGLEFTISLPVVVKT